ncbi:MAG: hypothetical protein WD708_07635 [Kiritimatiellia bacterium]
MHILSFAPLILLFSLFTPIWPPFATAQNDTLQCMIRFISWKNADPARVAVATPAGFLQTNGLQSLRRSRFIPYQGPANFFLLDPATLPADPPPEEPPPPPRSLARVRIPPGMRYALVIVFPAPEGSALPYQTLVINDDPEQFPFQSYQFINMSRQPVATVFAGERFVLEPGDFRKSDFEGESTINLLIAVPGREGQDWKLVYDSFFPVWAEIRNLVFIVNDPDSDRPRVIPRVLSENKGAWEKALKDVPPSPE